MGSCQPIDHHIQGFYLVMMAMHRSCWCFCPLNAHLAEMPTHEEDSCLCKSEVIGYICPMDIIFPLVVHMLLKMHNNQTLN